MKKLFVIRKYIFAESAKDAIRLDKKSEVDDVWVDEKWKEMNNEPKPMEGFKSKRNGKKQLVQETA